MPDRWFHLDGTECAAGHHPDSMLCGCDGGPVVKGPLRHNDAVKRRREAVGRYVRFIWLTWARQQPNPKPSWLLEWEDLDDAQREVDTLIGTAFYLAIPFLVRLQMERGERIVGIPDEAAIRADERRRCVAQLWSLLSPAELDAFLARHGLRPVASPAHIVLAAAQDLTYLTAEELFA